MLPSHPKLAGTNININVPKKYYIKLNLVIKMKVKPVINAHVPYILLVHIFNKCGRSL